LCCLGQDGRSPFNALLFHRGEPYFYAFDLLWVNLRRKEKPRSIMPEVAAPVLFTDYIDGTGIKLFAAACKCDLEGIVAKRKDSPYESGERGTSWVKIKNPHLCRARHKLGFLILTQRVVRSPHS
jgi:bifunctional non-homologous end joining protein LigD